MTNSKLGGRFEREFCDLLSAHGFWVHRIAQNNVGQQPADVIAVYHGVAYLIDCKVCSDDRFTYSRIEDNQDMAMCRWVALKNTLPKFALKDSKDRIWMLDFCWATACREYGNKSVACAEYKEFVIPFEKWLGQIT